MKRELKAALGIGGMVIVAAAIGLGLFLFTSSRLGVGFIAVGIPALLVVGVGAYVRGVVSRPGTSQSDYTRQQATDTATVLREFHSAFEELRSRYPTWDAAGVESDVDRIADDLDGQGVDFDVSAGTYSTKRFGSADVQELERIRSEVDDLDETLAASFESFVRIEVERLRDALERLDDADLAETGTWPGQQAVDDAAGDLDALEDALATHRERAAGTVDLAGDEIESLLGDVDDPVDEDRVRDLLADAETRTEADDYSGAVDAVLDAQAALEGELSGRFEADREAVEQLLETVQSSVVEQYVGVQHVERVEEIDDAMSSIDSALDVSDLQDYRDDLREACIAMVEEISEDLDDDLSALASADVPADYYRRPSAAAEDYPIDLRRVDSLEEFRLTWTSAVGDLSNALDQVGEKASVARSYNDIESIIEDELRTDAEVGGDDLPVKRADAFMDLYARTHPDVSYDPAGPTLSAAGEGERYDVTVFAQFDQGGPERTVALEIEGPGSTDSERAETHLAEEVTFEDVPYGEYTVRAVPGPDDYRTPEETVTVDDDTRIELTMAEVGLREQVCAGVEDDIREHLPELEGELDDQYDEAGYVSESMSYPIKDDYVPCLLALWAEQEGLAVTKIDDGVVAYDRDQATREVEMVLEHNLDAGDSMSFDDFRERFLSAPLPDDVVREIVGDSAKAGSVELTPMGVTKDE